jgi:hypothetical protein
VEPFLISGAVLSAISNILLRKNNEKFKIRKTRLALIAKSHFEAKIKNNKIEYARNLDEVIFILSYKGKIKQGFVACEIIPPSQFYMSIPCIDDEGHLSIFCDETVKQISRKQTIKNITREVANLCIGNYIIDKSEWSRKIPEFAVKGDYKVIIGIWDFLNDEANLGLRHNTENSFSVRDDNASYYMQKVNF